MTILWRSTKYRCFKVIMVMGLMFIPIIMYLHLYLLPDAHGAYNQECYLSKERHKDLLHAIHTIGKTMKKHNITYWLDFGTLLGAMRYANIIPWDGDADISFLLDEEKPEFHAELTKQHGINSISLVARYKKFRIDYVRWMKKEEVYNGKNETVLKNFVPDFEKKLKIVKYEILQQTVPLSWIVPTKEVHFGGVMLRIPNKPYKVLAKRYRFTYSTGFYVPYKWKCWVPCWIRTANGC